MFGVITLWVFLNFIKYHKNFQSPLTIGGRYGLRLGRNRFAHFAGLALSSAHTHINNFAVGGSWVKADKARLSLTSG